jgi:hypothetical protein
VPKILVKKEHDSSRIPREHLPQARGLEKVTKNQCNAKCNNQSVNQTWRLKILKAIKAMQNATTNQLTSGGHKSIHREHLPQACV